VLDKPTIPSLLALGQRRALPTAARRGHPYTYGLAHVLAGLSQLIDSN
jgi:hypothetical protein